MPTPLVSPAEKDYIEKGVHNDCRADGRGRLEYRHMVLETGLLSQANGSARCRLGDSDILVGVKVEIGDIEPGQPNEGRIECHVECSPSASQQFEGRGAEELNVSLTEALNRLFNVPFCGIDFTKLCIIPEQQCWVIHVDAIVMDCAGNLLDCIVMTARAALFNTRIPKTEIQDLGDGEYEFDVIDDIEAAEPLVGCDQLPLAVTLYKIGERYIVDPSVLEELCSHVTLTVGVNKKGEVCSIQKGQLGSIEPSLLTEMVQTATTLAVPLIKQLDDKLNQYEQEELATRRDGKPVEKVGFFAAVI